MTRDLLYVGVILVLVLIVIYLMARTQRSREMLDKLEKNEALMSIRLSSENYAERDAVEVGRAIINKYQWKFDKTAALAPVRLFATLIRGKSVRNSQLKSIGAFLATTTAAKLLDESGEDGVVGVMKDAMRHFASVVDGARLEIYSNDSFAYQMKFLNVVKNLNKSETLEPFRCAVLLAWLAYGEPSDSPYVEGLSEDLEDIATLDKMTAAEKKTAWEDIGVYLTRLDYNSDTDALCDIMEEYAARDR